MKGSAREASGARVGTATLTSPTSALPSLFCYRLAPSIGTAVSVQDSAFGAFPEFCARRRIAEEGRAGCLWEHITFVLNHPL